MQPKLHFAFLLILGCATQPAQRRSARPPRAKIGQRAPQTAGDTLNAKTYGAPRYDIDTVDGPLVVSFGASHCYPCLLELPQLKALHEQHGKKGLRMLLIVLDETAEGRDMMRTFVQDKLKLSFPVIADPDGRIADRYGVDRLPTLFLFDRDGRLTWRESGYKGDTIESLQRRLQALL